MKFRSSTALRTLVSVAMALSSAACTGTTGDDIIDFPAAAAGPADATAGQPLDFTTDRGWTVSLTKATLHVGAMYLEQSLPVSGAQNSACILPGTYVAEVLTALDIDLLSPAPQDFPGEGHGTTLQALVGQVWLTHGDVNEVADPDTSPILDVEGTATLGTDVRPFVGQITISSNRAESTGVTAGADPICKQRIVSPIETDVTLETTGGLLLRIDPRQLFVNVDFGQLVSRNGVYTFSDDPGDINPTSPAFYSQPSTNLYLDLHSAGSLFTFSWDPAL